MAQCVASVRRNILSNGVKEASRVESLENGFEVKKGKIVLRKDNASQKIVTEDEAVW